MSDDFMLQLLNVESAYGPIRAIRGVSLKVRQGEIATVLGSNGAGKTTILKTISGIIDPRKGSIEFRGRDITARDPAEIVQSGLSHVPEGREVFPLVSFEPWFWTAGPMTAQEQTRRLITLIFAGRNRMVMIRRELPRTRRAGWGRSPFRIEREESSPFRGPCAVIGSTVQ